MNNLRSLLRNRIKRLLNPVQWKNLRSTQPVSDVFGLDRGTAIDRYYIEKFLSQHNSDIQGIVLEIAESMYSKKYGGPKVTKYEVLHYTAGNDNATIIGDLTDKNSLPENKVDCFICTQTFNFIYDFKNAIEGAHYLLKPGGVLLATVGGISQISNYDMERWGDYWRFTTASALKTFEGIFGTDHVQVNSYGNVLTSVAFLEGIAAEELEEKELDYIDKNYQMLITIRAVK